MKNLISVALALMMAFSLAACGNKIFHLSFSFLLNVLFIASVHAA